MNLNVERNMHTPFEKSGILYVGATLLFYCKKNEMSIKLFLPRLSGFVHLFTNLIESLAN